MFPHGQGHAWRLPSSRRRGLEGKFTGRLSVHRTPAGRGALARIPVGSNLGQEKKIGTANHNTTLNTAILAAIATPKNAYQVPSN